MTRRMGILAILSGVVDSISAKRAEAIRELTVYVKGSSWEVAYGYERIRISYAEVMDALAGRVKPNHCPQCGYYVGPEPVAPKPPSNAWEFVQAHGPLDKASPGPFYTDSPSERAAWEKYDQAYETYKAKMLADPFNRGGHLGRCPRCSNAFYRDAEKPIETGKKTWTMKWYWWSDKQAEAIRTARWGDGRAVEMPFIMHRGRRIEYTERTSEPKPYGKFDDYRLVVIMDESSDGERKEYGR